MRIDSGLGRGRSSPYPVAMDDLIEHRDALIRTLCPHLSADQQRQAAETFDRYIDLLCCIALRLASENRRDVDPED